MIKEINEAANNTCLISLGQAGYIIKSRSGQTMAIDPYLSECVEREEGHIGFKRLLPKVILPNEIEFDCVVATHWHLDHFDVDAMPEIMRNAKTRLLASEGCSELVEKCKIDKERVYYVKPGHSMVIGDFSIALVDCDHGADVPDAVGVVVEVDGKRIYETGDTCFRSDRIKTIEAFGKIDVLIAPINGAYGNLNEEECVELSKRLKPRITIPCHYGMFASHGGNPGKFYNLMMERAPDNAFILMAQGERIII